MIDKEVSDPQILASLQVAKSRYLVKTTPPFVLRINNLP